MSIVTLSHSSDTQQVDSRFNESSTVQYCLDTNLFSELSIVSMASTLFVAAITAIVIVISSLLEFYFSFFQILFKRPLPSKGAVEIDPIQHVYAHPDYTDNLQESSTFDVRTVYEILLRGLKRSPNRPHFAYRSSSDQPFKSYTYK
jgi:hypothetical protein